MVRIEMSPEKAAMLREALVRLSFRIASGDHPHPQAVTVTSAKMLTIQSPDFSLPHPQNSAPGNQGHGQPAQVVAGRLAQFKGVLCTPGRFLKSRGPGSGDRIF